MWGQKLSFPAIVAPITGTVFNMGGYVSDEEYSNDVVLGAVEAGTLAMIGDTGDPKCFEYGISAVRKAGGKGIAIIKPRENEEIIKKNKNCRRSGSCCCWY